MTTDALEALTCDQTVPRSLVHVRALSEIFITDSEQTGEDEFVLAAQLPRAHTLWSDRLFGYHDPMVTIEVGRQAAFLVAHRYCGVPVNHPCLLHSVKLNIENIEAFNDDGLAPPEGTISARVYDKQRSDGALTSMGFAGEFRLGGSTAVTMSGQMAIFNRADYKLLRGQARARKDTGNERVSEYQHRMDPNLVGRRDERNVVIEELPDITASNDECRYSMIVDPTHPAFFDHQHDHVTGSLMMEVCRQSALAGSHRMGLLDSPVAAVTSCDASFYGLGELDAPTECTASMRRDQNDEIIHAELRLVQFGTPIADSKLTLTPMSQTRR